MINTVIFDIGKVLVSFDWRGQLRSMGVSPEEEEIIGKAMFQHEDWKELDRGVLTEQELLARFYSHAPQYADLMKQAFFGIFSSIRTFRYTKDWITRLKEAGLRVYYLSNYGEHVRQISRETLAFTELMDGGLFSYQVKMIKPSPWIYAELFRRYQITPEEAVFIDDTAENIEAAKALGLHTIHFTSYEQAVEELKKLGVQ